MKQVAKLVGKKTKPFPPACGFHVDGRLAAFEPVLRHGHGDGVIEAGIQQAEVIGADRRLQFHRQLGDRLADVPVVVNDLGDGEALETQIVPMAGGRSADFRTGQLSETQCVGQLVEKERDAVRNFRLGRRRYRPLPNLRSAPANDLVTMKCDEVVEH